MGDTHAIDSLERGIETAKSGNKLLARLHLLQAVELAPRDPNCWLWLAWVAESPASAIHSLQRVLDENPDHELALLGMQWAKAMADFELGDYEVQTGEPDTAEPDTAEIGDPETGEAPTSSDDDDFSAEGDPDQGFSDEQPAAEVNFFSDENKTDDFAGEGESFFDEEPDEAGCERDSFAKAAEINAESEPEPAGEWDSPSDSEPTATDTAEWSLNAKQETEPAEAEEASEQQSTSEWFAESFNQAEDEEAGFENDADFGEHNEAQLAAEEEHSFAEEAEAEADETNEINEADETGFSWEENAEAESRDEENNSPSAWGAPIAESNTEESLVEDADADEPEETLTAENSPGSFWGGSETASEEAAETGQDPQDFSDAETESEPTEVEAASESEIEEALAEQDPSETVLPPMPAVESESSVSVLVVDDSPTVRKLVAMTLEKNGYTVAAAPDGVVALKSIAELKPRLILLDITMPRLGGYQLCKLIKKHESTKHIPVIMLSGKDGMFDKVRGKFVGCDDYITKPFDPDLLIEKVSTQLTEHYGVAAAQS